MLAMPATKRATIYFDPALHRALRITAAANDTSISEIVNDAVRRMVGEDADDLEDLDKIRREPDVDFESYVRDLKRRGKL